jgi:hypothetical protein
VPIATTNTTPPLNSKRRHEMSHYVEELQKLDEHSLEWFEALDRFGREDPEGYRRWLDEEWEREQVEREETPTA